MKKKSKAKVYCGECEYLKCKKILGLDFQSNSEICECLNDDCYKTGGIDTSVGILYTRDVYQLNKNNDCKFFKAKNEKT
jgi:hypothetical protein